MQNKRIDDVIEIDLDEFRANESKNGYILHIGGETALQMACQYAAKTHTVSGFECEKIPQDAGVCYLSNGGDKRVRKLLLSPGKDKALRVSSAVIEDRKTGTLSKFNISKVFFAQGQRRTSLVLKKENYGLLQHAFDYFGGFRFPDYYERLNRHYHKPTAGSLLRHAFNLLLLPRWIYIPVESRPSKNFSTLKLQFQVDEVYGSLIDELEAMCDRPGIAKISNTCTEKDSKTERTVTFYGATKKIALLKKDINSIVQVHEDVKIKCSQNVEIAKLLSSKWESQPNFIPLADNFYIGDTFPRKTMYEYPLIYGIVNNDFPSLPANRQSTIFRSQVQRRFGIDTSLSIEERLSFFFLSLIGTVAVLKKARRVHAISYGTALRGRGKGVRKIIAGSRHYFVSLKRKIKRYL